METKMPAGSASACVREFVDQADSRIKQVFSQVWRGVESNPILVRQEFCPVEIVHTSGTVPPQTTKVNFHKPDAN